MNIKNLIDRLIDIWHLPQRFRDLETTLQAPTTVVGQINNFGSFYLSGQFSPGTEEHIYSTTIDCIEVISEEAFESLPEKKERTLYLTTL